MSEPRVVPHMTWTVGGANRVLSSALGGQELKNKGILPSGLWIFRPYPATHLPIMGGDRGNHVIQRTLFWGSQTHLAVDMCQDAVPGDRFQCICNMPSISPPYTEKKSWKSHEI
jgi:hypothetical protein